VGTYVVPYDPFNGFGGIKRVDTCEGISDCPRDSMHVNVSITEGGRIAVVWEELDRRMIQGEPRVSVFLRTRVNGVWSSPFLVNSGHQRPKDSMLPSVVMNDSGDIVVTYTYGPLVGQNPAAGTATRRQYVRHYYVHVGN
jgi:hypothetical protein